jgi:hypothetical protein
MKVARKISVSENLPLEIRGQKGLINPDYTFSKVRQRAW